MPRSRYWARHVSGEAEKNPDVLKVVTDFLRNENKRKSMLQIGQYALSSDRGNIWAVYRDRGQTMLHVLAEEGLSTICESVLTTQQNMSDLIHIAEHTP